MLSMSALSPNFSKRPFIKKVFPSLQTLKSSHNSGGDTPSPGEEANLEEKLTAQRATEETPSLHQMVESHREQVALLKVL